MTLKVGNESTSISRWGTITVRTYWLNTEPVREKSPEIFYNMYYVEGRGRVTLPGTEISNMNELFESICSLALFLTMMINLITNSNPGRRRNESTTRKSSPRRPLHHDLWTGVRDDSEPRMLHTMLRSSAPKLRFANLNIIPQSRTTPLCPHVGPNISPKHLVFLGAISLFV